MGLTSLEEEQTKGTGSALGAEQLEPITLWWLTSRVPQPMSLPDQIAARVAERIITGAVPPGAHLTEEAVSAEIGVSRAPVREALRILERQHLIEMLARRGARVSLLTEQGVWDITEFWAALLQIIGRRLAAMGNPEMIARLESKAEDLLTYAEDSAGPGRYLWGVQDLVTTMANETGNPHVVENVANLVLQIYRYARLSLSTVAQRQKTARQWRDVVRHIKRLDSDGATRTLVRLVELARDRAIAALREHAESGRSSPQSV